MRFRSRWAQAQVAAYRAVRPPVTAMAVWATGEAPISGYMRASRYTPAVTMVAAWIWAETGVGPAMASGSQTISGTWADLPMAASSSNKPRTVIRPRETVDPI